jgi:hypothetical protein
MFDSETVEILRRVHRDICDHLPLHETAKRIDVAVALVEGARVGMSMNDLHLKGQSVLEIHDV